MSIALSARTNESNKVAALDAVADDYLPKPFGMDELIARGRANLHRPRAAAAEAQSDSITPANAVFTFGGVEVNCIARSVGTIPLGAETLFANLHGPPQAKVGA